ncbi:MAG: site-2 protease family protein [Thermodesulfovibrionales bacterium]
MNGAFFQGSWKIFTISGIPIRIHFSWLIVFGLITWSLSTYYFPKAAPELPASSQWIKGTAGALLLFASVTFHELAHSFVSRRYKITILSITLFIFGGVAQMKGEPPTPKAELRIAIAGPLSSFFLSGIFFMLYIIASSPGVKAFYSYLAQINLILGVFNLIPGFPMDGGRVLRSIIWEKTKDYFHATKKASGIGQKIALFFIFFGLFSILTGFAGGFWLMLIGWFLYTAAQSSFQQATFQESLSGVKVKDVMTRNIVTLNSAITVEEAVNDFFLKYGYGGFPVFEDNRFVGIITLKEIRDIPRADWLKTKVSDILIPRSSEWEVSPEDDALKALELMIMKDKGRLAVTEKDNFIGLITRNGIARYIQIMKK